MKILAAARNESKWDMKHLLMELAVGKHKQSPFDAAVVDEIRVELRIICKQAGFGPGLPEEGDVVQTFEVRLIQSLLRAFQRSRRTHVSLVVPWRMAGITTEKAAENPSSIRPQGEMVQDRTCGRIAPGVAVELPLA